MLNQADGERLFALTKARQTSSDIQRSSLGFLTSLKACEQDLLRRIDQNGEEYQAKFL